MLFCFGWQSCSIDDRGPAASRDGVAARGRHARLDPKPVTKIYRGIHEDARVLDLGFWMCGDRDTS